MVMTSDSRNANDSPSLNSNTPGVVANENSFPNKLLDLSESKVSP